MVICVIIWHTVLLNSALSDSEWTYKQLDRQKCYDTYQSKMQRYTHTCEDSRGCCWCMRHTTQPACDISSRLPLPSATLIVTYPSFRASMPLAITNLYCLVHVCERLAQGYYTTANGIATEPMSSRLLVQWPAHCTTLHTATHNWSWSLFYIVTDTVAVTRHGCLQCFDAVGWVAGRASGL